MRITKILLAFFLIITYSAFSQVKQDTVIVVQDDSRVKLIITPKKNTNFKKIVRLKNGLLDGMQETTQWGSLTQTNYTDGFKNGEEKLFDNQGNVKEIRNYKYLTSKKRSVLQGSVLQYHDKLLYSKIPYKDSIQQGTATYYSNGAVTKKEQYKDGFIIKTKGYYKNKNKAYIRHFKIVTGSDGKRKTVKHGLFIEYKEFGSISSKGKYKHDKKEGLWRVANYKNNLLQNKTYYKDGKIYGTRNTYHDNGKPDMRSTFYEEIVKKGIKYTNIYDGKYETFYPDGTLKELKNLENGNLQGAYNQFYENGSLRETAIYKDGLIAGAIIKYDKDGRKNSEITYAVLQTQKGPKNIRQGHEYEWKNGILIKSAAYLNDTINGLCMLYHNNGRLSDSVFYDKGLLSGIQKKYYANGTIKGSYSYDVTKMYELRRQSYNSGWQYSYDEQGKPETYKYFNSNQIKSANENNNNENILMRWQYGVLTEYKIDNSLQFLYTPRGGLASFNVGHEQFPSIGFTYYLNGNIRLIKYQDSETGQNAVASYMDDGTLINVHEFNGQDKGAFNNAIPTALYNLANPAWVASPLFADATKNGVYELFYKNRKLFLHIEYRDNLLNGNFFVLEPIASDTLVSKRYKDGRIIHHENINFGGKRPYSTTKYYPNGKLGESARWTADGKQNGFQTYDENGKPVLNNYYSEEGKLQSVTNYKDGSYIAYNTTGVLVTERKPVINKPGWQQSKKWYDNGILKEESLYTQKENNNQITTKYYLDGTRETYYEEHDTVALSRQYYKDGSLKLEGKFINSRREGTWTTYENGKATHQKYENGVPIMDAHAPKCGCADPGREKKIFYAPSLDNLADWVNLKRRIPAFLQPVDSLNYKSVFYKNFQSSTGGTSGFASFTLLLFKEFAFTVRVNDIDYAKISLNPCQVKQAITEMPVTVSYDFERITGTHGQMQPKRISLELLNNPLASNDTDYKNVLALTDVYNINYGDEFDINPAKEPHTCITAGIVKGLLRVDAIAATLHVNENKYFNYPNTQAIGTPIFTGLNITDGVASFTYNNTNITCSIKQILAGNGFVAGTINIPCNKVADKDFFILTGTAEGITINKQLLEEYWKKNGFARTATFYNGETHNLDLYFYAE